MQFQEPWQVVSLSFVLLLAAIALPLIPATVIYKYFPSTEVGLRGPFHGLTLNATGAFAAYVIVFLLSTVYTLRTFESLGSMLRPSWTITGTIKVLGVDGVTVLPDSALIGSNIAVRPELSEIVGSAFTIRVPFSYLEGWPRMTITVPQVGSANISIAELGASVEKDDFWKRMEIREPIVIRANRATDRPYKVEQSKYLNAPGSAQ